MERTQELCPICGENPSLINAKGDLLIVDCPRCGRFEISGTALTLFQNSEEKDKVLSVSFWLRKNQSDNIKRFVTLDSKNLRELLVPFIPLRPIEQANNLLLWVGNKIKKADERVVIPLRILISVTGSSDEDELHYVIRYLMEQGLLENASSIKALSFNKDEPRLFEAKMTFSGWSKYDELLRVNEESHLVFMAMKYDQEPLETLFMDVIKPAVDGTGFEIRKLTEEKRAGLIDDKLRVEIRRSKFLIADLTHDNNGAYWEAGYAEGLGLPVIYICEKNKFDNQKSHFDTNHHLTVPWEEDPNTWRKFAEELKATIRATFPAEAKMDG